MNFVIALTYYNIVALIIVFSFQVTPRGYLRVPLLTGYGKLDVQKHSVCVIDMVRENVNSSSKKLHEA